MLIRQSFATQPLNCRNVWTPSNIRMCVNPISLMNSSLECSGNVGMVLVTLNMVLMMSCDEYPRSLPVPSAPPGGRHGPDSPKFLECVQGIVDLALPARLDHGLHLDRVRAVDDPKYIVATDESEARPGALKIVDRLSHVSFSAKDQCRQPVLRPVHFFRFNDLVQPADDLCIRQARVSENGASRLEGLNNFVRLVAGKSEAGGVGVDFHCATKGLLRTSRHTTH